MTMQVRVLPVSKFAQRVSYQSTCVKIRTIFGLTSERAPEITSEKFTKRTSGNNCSSNLCNLSETSALNHRMPVVAAAVAAHRRVFPSAGSLAGSTAGSKRSSCVTRLSVATAPLISPGLTSKKTSHVPSQFTTGGTFTKGGGLLTGGIIVSRPLVELKQLGQFLNNNNNVPPLTRAAVIADAKRYYAKGRDKPKSKKSSVQVNENEMAQVIDVDKFKKHLEKLLVQMKDDFTKQLSIRGAAGALESLEVDFEGEKYPLQELAQVGRKNPQLAILNLASLPDAIKPVLKAIEESGLNLNPQQEGTTIYLPLPKVTREHRETLAKNAKLLFTKYKVAMQGVQNKFIKDCRNQKDMSEDLVFSVQQQIMKYTENIVAEAEKLMELKQKELLDTK